MKLSTRHVAELGEHSMSDNHRFTSPSQDESDKSGQGCGFMTVNWLGAVSHDSIHGSKYSENITRDSSAGVFGNIGRAPFQGEKAALIPRLHVN